jgi:hypothetical protein
MRGRTKIILSALVLVVGTAAIAWPRIDFFMLTGHFTPIRKVESLRTPVRVQAWTADGLLLADGRTLPLPKLRALPSQSAALSEVIKRGVEVASNGRVYGLVRVHHWCGNDPVREHIARVDISDMMTFLRVGETVGVVPEAQSRVHEPGGAFSKWGWRVGEFYQFESWQRLRNSEHEPSG